MQQFTVTGMSCAACSARVEQAVGGVKGVTACTVNLLTGRMAVEGDVPAETIVNAVKAAGYGVAEDAPSADDLLKDRETPALKRRLWWSLGFLVMLMYLSMGHVMWGAWLPSFLEHPVLVAGLQMVLAIVVMVINRKFFINGIQGVLHKAPNMDTLVAMGSAAAFVYSTAVWIGMFTHPETAHAGLHDLYFESAAMILALITVGKMLEARSKGKTTDALKGLMKLAPKTATVLVGGEEHVVPVTEVQIGDVFVVRSGEAFPVDGVVLDGDCAVDESSLTGESIPVDKAAGDDVWAATINRAGFVQCKATRVGADTTLSQIIQMVSSAASTKAPIAKIADKVSGVFVPAVISIAVITTLVWLLLDQSFGFALARGISVLVISCPCALGLATPVAIMVGSGVGAKHGILFKTAVSLEQAGRVDTVVLDKTGTVTVGHPTVTDVFPQNGVSAEELLTLAASIEHKSEHPLGQAVVAYAKQQNVLPEEVADFHVTVGNGVTATYRGESAVAGNARYMAQYVPLTEEVTAVANALAEQGKTPLFFAKGGILAGIVAVADAVKEDSATAVHDLQNMGIRVVMLTGDNERTARAVATAVGADEVIAGVLPDGKEAAVRKLQQTATVAMVGDGINDAPALTAADIGIAIGAGTDIAIDAADIVLMKSRLSDVAAAIRLSRATLRNIRQNLFWAFLYNSIGIPLAAGAFIGAFGWQLNPMFGAAAMSLSSACVVSNALRLNFFKLLDNRHDRPHRTKRKTAPQTELVLRVDGMMCEHCEAHMKAALEDLPQVQCATADHTTGTVKVTLTAPVKEKVFRKTIEREGYTFVVIE